jgi:phosphoribosyl 1,2-cyclic phosphate phosphodiesterase
MMHSRCIDCSNFASMTITFLGTGTSQGVPLIACPCPICNSEDPRDTRLRSSVMISIDGKNFVIDSGPDFRQQMLREKVKSIEGIIFTHEHKDHIAGLDDVRAYNFINNWRAQVYCTEQVAEALKREFSYAFSDKKYPGVPEIDLNIIDDRSFEIGPVAFQPIQVYHLRLPVFGFRVGNFAYITDANVIPEEEFEKLHGLEVLVLNALRREKHPSHFTLEEAIDIAKRVGAQQTWFTHISHQLGLHEDVNKELPETMFLAYDGLTLEVMK